MMHHRRPDGRIERCSDKHQPGHQLRSGLGRTWASMRLLTLRRPFRGRTYVHNDSNGQKYQIVLPCQVPNGKRQPARRCIETSRLARKMGVWESRAEDVCLESLVVKSTHIGSRLSTMFFSKTFRAALRIMGLPAARGEDCGCLSRIVVKSRRWMPRSQRRVWSRSVGPSGSTPRRRWVSWSAHEVHRKLESLFTRSEKDTRCAVGTGRETGATGRQTGREARIRKVKHLWRIRG
jgi:hypothetical protein